VSLFDRPTKAGEKTLLIHVTLGKPVDPAILEEFQELAAAAGAEVSAVITATRDKPDSKTFVGSGKLDEIRQMVSAREVALVIFNHELSPSQERNLEKELCCRVISRTGLILDIFAGRAQTFEGKLQVELAQLKHMSTRLVRGWTHLERQKGGIGLRGPGETQLETDRRLLQNRIQLIEDRLEKVKQQRALSRRARQKRELPTVALVGYTNVGKSTLFNTLTGAEVLEADQLFATLDPTHRMIHLATVGKVILIDTVGFIRDLPHELVDAFHATLEETALADVLCHVIDLSHPEHPVMTREVMHVLDAIGANEVPMLLVYNKIDCLPEPMKAHVRQGADGKATVWLSAKTGDGLPLLLESLSDFLGQDRVAGTLMLTPAQGAIRARLHELDAIQSEMVNEEGGWDIEVSILTPTWNQLAHHFPVLNHQWR
jgi:GTPase